MSRTLLGLKCAILVHTSALLGQWIERIKQFLPDARVGVLQGPNRPGPDDDVCVCMLQTLTKLRSGSVVSSFRVPRRRRVSPHLLPDLLEGVAVVPSALRAGAECDAGACGPAGVCDRMGWSVRLLYSLKRVTSGVKVHMIAYKNEGFQHATRRWDKTQLDYVKTLSLLVDDQWRTRPAGGGHLRAGDEGVQAGHRHCVPHPAAERPSAVAAGRGVVCGFCDDQGEEGCAGGGEVEAGHPRVDGCRERGSGHSAVGYVVPGDALQAGRCSGAVRRSDPAGEECACAPDCRLLRQVPDVFGHGAAPGQMVPRRPGVPLPAAAAGRASGGRQPVHGAGHPGSVAGFACRDPSCGGTCGGT